MKVVWTAEAIELIEGNYRIIYRVKDAEIEIVVCNVGDMLDYLTGGRYLSVPHRVKNRSGRSRLSFPFFFDPDFGARMRPVPGAPEARRVARWDDADLHAFQGLYGDYLLRKVAKVFPDLAAHVVSD